MQAQHIVMYVQSTLMLNWEHEVANTQVRCHHIAVLALNAGCKAASYMSKAVGADT